MGCKHIILDYTATFFSHSFIFEFNRGRVSIADHRTQYTYSRIIQLVKFPDVEDQSVECAGRNRLKKFDTNFRLSVPEEAKTQIFAFEEQLVKNSGKSAGRLDSFYGREREKWFSRPSLGSANRVGTLIIVYS